jgi:septal ring factor EnvC (AmiA/AmiB activator)
MEDIQYLASKCETYEADLAKLKKLLVYERSLNEGLRKTLDETRTGLRDELAACQAENTKLREDWQREKAKREFLQTSSDEATTTLLRYKQQLEKAESKLSDCLL